MDWFLYDIGLRHERLKPNWDVNDLSFEPLVEPTVVFRIPTSVFSVKVTD